MSRNHLLWACNHLLFVSLETSQVLLCLALSLTLLVSISDMMSLVRQLATVGCMITTESLLYACLVAVIVYFIFLFLAWVAYPKQKVESEIEAVNQMALQVSLDENGEKAQNIN